MSLIEIIKQSPNDLNNKELDRVLQLIRNGADVNATDGAGSSPLHWAAPRGQYDVCMALLENGANVNTLDNINGWSPLMWAIYHYHINVVRLLLHNGASLEIIDSKNRTPLDVAKACKQPQMVEMIEKQFPLWLRLYHAARQGNYDECVALLKQKVLHETCQDGLYCPLTAATKKGHRDIVKLLLEKGAYVNYEHQNNERNPLYLATKKGHKDIVALLFDKGGDGNVKVNGDSLLHVATRKNDENLVRLLILNEVNPNEKDNDGYTSLHYAILNGHGDIANQLIQHNASVNLATKRGETPLHLACEVGHKQIVEILLKNGANTDALDEESNKPMDILIRKCSAIAVDAQVKIKILENIKALLIPPKEANQTPVAKGASNEGRLEVNKDNSHDDSNSDVTVENPLSTMGSILDTTDIEELNTKLAELSALVLEFHDLAVNLEITETYLALETDTVTYLNRKMEKTRVLKRLKSKDLKSQLAYEGALQQLPRKVDESERKQAALAVERLKFQTEIPSLKTNLKNVYREITRILNKIDMICICS